MSTVDVKQQYNNNESPLLGSSLIPGCCINPRLLLQEYRALDKREYLVIIRDDFSNFCIKTLCCDPHLNRLNETVQMRGHNIWFR